MEDQLEAEIEAGILEPVRTSEWACQIVPIVKQDGKSIRICGNFKQTANRAIKVDKHPVPKVKDMFAKLSGGKVFAKLDLSRAYQQLKVAEEHRSLLTINTHRGLFRYRRLAFGVSSAVGIFQREMERLLAGIPGIFIYLDDILLSGRSDDELLVRLEQVLQVFQEAGLKVKPEKCVFLTKKVEYLGYVLDSAGAHATEAKVRAITDSPVPKNVTELKSFLGIFNYYSRFIPKRAQTLSPLYDLLKKNQPWSWEECHRAAFDECKNLLVSNQLLVHFDPDLPMVLACDASCWGIGAVLSHVFPDGSERPIQPIRGGAGYYFWRNTLQRLCVWGSFPAGYGPQALTLLVRGEQGYARDGELANQALGD